MSRRDKRAGREKYDLRGVTDDQIRRQNSFKALFGKHFSHPMSEPMMALGAVEKVLKIAEDNPKDFGELAKRKFVNVRLKILWEFNQYLSSLVERWDWQSIIKFGEMMAFKNWDHTADAEAWEIFRAYIGLRYRKGRLKNPAPSGKDLAFFIDKLRVEEGKTPSGKTIDAIRERALRLGLKLKGKRKKKK